MSEPAPDSWFRHLPSRTVRVVCDEATHRVRWNNGELELLDHDIDAEKALGALGAERSRCLEILETWNDAADAPRIGIWRLQGLPAPGPDLRQADDSEPTGKGLPTALRVLSTLASIADLDRRWDDEDLPKPTRDALRRFATERLHAAADVSMEASRQLRRRLRIRIRVQPVESETRMEITAEAAPGQLVLSVVLPISWMIDVWGRGAAVVGDRLLLALAPLEADGEVVLDAYAGWAIAWEIASRNVLIPRVEAIELSENDDGAWQIQPASTPPPVAEPWCSVRTRTVR